MPLRVLIFASEAPLRAAIARGLAPLKPQIEIASSERTIGQLLETSRFHAAVIAPASQAPGDLEVLREVEAAVDKFVVLTDNEEAGTRLGACFTQALVCRSKPAEFERIIAFLANGRASHVVDESGANDLEQLRFAGRTLDVGGRILLDAEGQEVPLTRREFALLLAFAHKPSRVLSRDQLRKAIDGGTAEAYDRSVDMLVARLRRKIEPNKSKSAFIITVPGAGYKFVPQVRVSNASALIAATRPAPAEANAGKPIERRQLTVLSCQILGFATLAAEIDPEDLQRTIGGVYAACAEVVGRHGGTTEHAIGDGVLAYFGHPKATEHDAESAVRAALDLVRTIGSIEAALIGRFRARVGVATGLMLVGGMGTDPRRETTVPAIGAALNLAQHLRQAAPTGVIVVAASTRKLLGRLFDCREIEPVMLEDGGEPVPAFQVTEASAAMTRFDALRRDGMLPLVGRTAEMERLIQYWAGARRGTGQVVLLNGEAGIGKSRLAIELQRTLRHEPHNVIRCSGSPHRSEAPMAALLDAVQRAAGFAAADPAEQKLHKLNAAFAVLGAAATEATVLIAGLLGLPCETPAQIKELSPQKRKERVFAALLDGIERTAASRPVLAVVEDAQWLDPTSLEFLTLLVERAGTLRLLLLTVARPDFTPPWPDYSYVSTLKLSRLSRSDSALLIHAVAGERPISPAVEDEIVCRADGVSLFVEELTKSILESSAKCDSRALPPPAPANAPIPSTLHGLLLTRFDRLDRGKEVAQVGAVIGREFSFEVLRIVAGLDEPVLRAALHRLVASGLVFRRGSPPEATFVFKHALVRDAAYGMLPRERRQALHAGVARAYEENLAHTAQAQPELLAYHWREGGDPDKAVSYLLTAAERALYRSATTEALSHLGQARELISNQPANQHRLQLELTLELTSARALLAMRGYTAIETRQAYQRARDRCEVLGDQSSLPLIIHGQWLGAWMTADHPSALEQARELHSWGDRNRDQVGLAMAHCDFGMTLTTLGRLLEAHNHLDQALKINSFFLPGRQPFVASDVDGRISALSFMHNCLLLLGFPDQAEAAAKEAASLNPENLYSQALAQTRTLRMRVFERNAHSAAEIGNAVLRLCQEQGYPHFISTAMIYLGWAVAQCGDAAGGTPLCERGLAQLQSVGAKCWLPLHLALLAECYEQAGDRCHAAETVAQALGSVEATGERIWESEIYRLKGTLLLGAGDNTEAAEGCFVTALNKARTQQTKLLELRAAISLAKLLMRERKSKQARNVLAPVYGSFTEGLDSLHLREAKMLLDTLSESLRRGNQRSIVGRRLSYKGSGKEGDRSRSKA